MADPVLRTVTRTQGANAALKNGDVRVDGARLAFEEVPVLVHAFRRMVRGLEFDVCEMALTTYLVARSHGVRFTALPAFLVRGFHHGAVLVAPGSGVRRPEQLAGRRVGVSRGYTVTTGVWARAILRDEHGLDPAAVTWVLSGDEHVEAFRPPGNVEPMPAGADLEDLVLAGDLAAAIGTPNTAGRLVPLLPDPHGAALTAVRERGLYPINHLVVVRDELLLARPELGPSLLRALTAAKDRYVERLRAGIDAPDATDAVNLAVLHATGADPLPYGVGPNRAVLETLVRHAVDQRILERPVPLEGLFAPGAADPTA